MSFHPERMRGGSQVMFVALQTFSHLNDHHQYLNAGRGTGLEITERRRPPNAGF